MRPMTSTGGPLPVRMTSWDPARDATASSSADRTPGPVAVGHNAGVGHPVAEEVLTLLHVAGIDARGGDADPDLGRSGLRVGHLADHQDVTCRPLSLVPRCSHGPTQLDSAGVILRFAK